MNLAGILCVVVIAGFFSGCSQTTLKSEWKDPGYTGPGVHSVMVLCLPADSKEKECEDEFVRQLKEPGGIAAIPWQDTPAAPVSKESAMAKAREMGVSTVLVSRFIERKSELDISPSEADSLDNMILMPDPNLWSDYPEYVENQYQVYGTALYNAADGKAIWSAVSDTYERKSGEKTLVSYVKAMIKKMKHRGLLSR